jgi:hypothetical protein
METSLSLEDIYHRLDRRGVGTEYPRGTGLLLRCFSVGGSCPLGRVRISLVSMGESLGEGEKLWGSLHSFCYSSGETYHGLD